MIEKSGARTMVIEMKEKSQIFFEFWIPRLRAE